MKKRISADYVLNSLINRFGFKGINDTAVFENIGDAINLIGYGLHLETKYKQVEINFYKIPYPCDCVNFYNAYYKGRKLLRKTNRKINETSNPYSWLENTITANIKQINTLDIEETLQNQDTLDDREDLLKQVIESFSVIDTWNSVQIDNSNWIEDKSNIIETSIESGNVYLEYSVFAVDERGVPYLYDEQRYLDGVIYYCAAMAIQSGYQHPTISYPMAMDNMERYLARARNFEKRLTPIQAGNFKDTWTNMVSDLNYFYE
jgi:hypothetical protein